MTVRTVTILLSMIRICLAVRYAPIVIYPPVFCKRIKALPPRRPPAEAPAGTLPATAKNLAGASAKVPAGDSAETEWSGRMHYECSAMYAARRTVNCQKSCNTPAEFVRITIRFGGQPSSLTFRN